jgi:hypothetical protein
MLIRRPGEGIRSAFKYLPSGISLREAKVKIVAVRPLHNVLERGFE